MLLLLDIFIVNQTFGKNREIFRIFEGKLLTGKLVTAIPFLTVPIIAL